MKILAVGDAHGDIGYWTKYVLPAARQRGIDTIVQVGDFGYWEHTREGLKYLARLSEATTWPSVEIYFVDGNHENHDFLYGIYHAHQSGPPRPTMIRHNIYHLPRGAVMTWGGRRFLACGGAYSIDHARRTMGQDWWVEETVTPTDVQRCRSIGKADVLISHDCPEGVAPKGDHAWMKECPETATNRRRLTEVMTNARCQLVVHGHWHHYHDDRTLNGVRVIGLDCNHRPRESMVIINTDDLSVYQETP